MADITADLLQALDDLFDGTDSANLHRDTLDFSNGRSDSSSDDLPPAANSGVNWYGTRGGDKLWGTNRADIIHGRGGDDDIRGWKGADRLFGNGGNDSIAGWEGKDLIYGGIGNDGLDGGEGNDRIFGQKGNDRIFGAAGNDLIKGGKGADYIEGGEGNDRLLGGAGDDIITGDSGSTAVGGRNVIIGGRGNDELYGNNLTRFVFDDGWGHDTIKLFTGTLDLTRVKGLHSRDQLSIKPVNNGVLIKFHSDSIELWSYSQFDIAEIDILV